MTEDIQQQKHIALFMPSFRGGGAERVMVTLANCIAAQGFVVDLVITNAVGPYRSEVASNVRVVNLAQRRMRSSLVPLIKYLRKEQPDVMLSALNYANLIAILARMFSRVRFRLVVSERSNFSNSILNLGLVRGYLYRALVGFMYPFADHVIAVSEGVADDLARSIGLDRSAISVIYNPVVTDELIRMSKEIPDHPWCVQGGIPVILAVGRLTRAKDFETLINAFSIVRLKRLVKLIILGEGELRNQLVNQVKHLNLENEVDLPGFVSNPMAYMSFSSIFVLSSAWEGLPNSLIQAMACGTPVVSTDCQSGPSEILDGGYWGRLVEVGNVEELAAAIEQTLNDKQHPDVRLRSRNFMSGPITEQYLKRILDI